MKFTEGIDIQFKTSNQAWASYKDTLSSLFDRFQPSAVCDIGGGRHPQVSQEMIEQRGFDYTLLDISQEELAQAPSSYKTLCLDIASPDLTPEARFDFVFSKMLAEHVRDGVQFHKNVFQMLKPGGIAFHFFPTLFAPPFIANYLIPDRLSRMLLDLFQPRQAGKFPAHYSGCRGPTPKQIALFHSLGYEIKQYWGFFGHQYYRRIPLLRSLHQRTMEWLARHPLPQLTSFAFLVLQKPAQNAPS